MKEILRISQDYGFSTVYFHQLSGTQNSDFKEFVKNHQDVVMNWCRSNNGDIKMLHPPK